MHGGYLFIDSANLVVHEGGHLLFRWFGATLCLWGGTILQWLVPFLLAAYFFHERQPAAFVFCTFFFFENWLYTATYMADARAMVLPLVTTGDPDYVEHDWNTIFTSLGVLPYDTSPSPQSCASWDGAECWLRTVWLATRITTRKNSAFVVDGRGRPSLHQALSGFQPPEARRFAASVHGLPSKCEGSAKPKQFQNRRRHIHNRRLFFDELVARKQNSRNQPRVDAVVAAPGLDIVLENLRGDFAHHRIPRSAIARAVADNQVGRIFGIRPAINIVGNKHARDADRAGSRIHQPIQLFCNSAFRASLRRDRQFPASRAL
jgi:hypothetical protein